LLEKDGQENHDDGGGLNAAAKSRVKKKKQQQEGKARHTAQIIIIFSGEGVWCASISREIIMIPANRTMQRRQGTAEAAVPWAGSVRDVWCCAFSSSSQLPRPIPLRKKYDLFVQKSDTKMAHNG
jgi:hypothetical protein